MEIFNKLSKEYNSFPATGRIIVISSGLDITPKDAKGIDYLNTFKLNEVDIIVPPQDPLTIIVSIFVSVALTLALTPKIPNAANRNIPEASPNNGLNARTNTARLGARRPYILGTVNSVPDLLTAPYKVFDASGREIEFNYMFVSEGIVSGSVFKDGSTQLKYISGSSLELYYPNKSPLAGSPEISIGSPITEPFITAKRYGGVNGQLLRPPNKVETTRNIRIYTPNRFKFQYEDELLDKYKIGEEFRMSNSVVGGEDFSRNGYINGSSIRFNNTKLSNLPASMVVGNQLHAKNQDHVITTITSITENSETVTGSSGTVVEFYIIVGVSSVLDSYDPGGNIEVTIGSDLFDIGKGGVISDITEDTIRISGHNWPSWFTGEFYHYRSFSVEGIRWSDYFVLDDFKLEGFIANLVASNGIFKDNGSEQIKENVTCVLGVTAIDENDDPIGSEQTFETILSGSSIIRDSVNKTLRDTFSGRCRVRMHRSSYSDNEFDGQVIDDVKWKDLYSFEYIKEHDISNNTRIRTATIATEGALSLKERQLIIEDATRNLPKRLENGNMSNGSFPTTSAADALVALAVDPFIGNRNIDELNLDQIYETVEDIKDYFNNPNASDFSYTLDSSDLTFEDSFSMVANAIYCKPYRRSLVHYLSFEKPQNTSTLLFNHRNKIPNSESRRIEFGITNNADGVICNWIDSAGLEHTVSVPNEGLHNPIEVSLLGLNEFQATKHAWREWYKAKYQRLFTQFDSTSEASLSVLGQKILVANNISSNSYDGEVREQDGLILTLSHDVPEEGWIHLQLPNAQTQAIKYNRTEPNKIRLLNPTSMVLSTEQANYAKSTYLISESSTEEDTFLLLERSGDSVYNMTLGNYDARFYQEDTT